MKKVLFFILMTIVNMSFFSCGNQSGEKSQVDSLRTDLEERNAEYKQLNEFLAVVSSGLDSISRQESDIYNTGKESPILDRHQMMENLAQFQQLIKNQRERISQLENKLSKNEGDAQMMRAIITSLKAQLTEKEYQIAALQGELENKNFTIQALQQRIGSMSRHINQQEDVITAQNELMEQQDNIINEGFIKIASKRELKSSGLLSSGFLKKNKIDYDKIDKSLFRAVDIRKLTELDINSKNPKILTEVPSDAYVMETNGDMTKLRIVNPGKFWSISKFIIIQI